MTNTFYTSYTSIEDSADNFICRVLNQFSRWCFNVDYIFSMLEYCADDLERLDIIESCLNALVDFQVEPENFLSQIACDDLNDLIQDASIAVESKELLNDLEEIRTMSSPVLYEGQWAA